MKMNKKIIRLKRYTKSLFYYERSVAIILTLALVLSLGVVALPMAGTVAAQESNTLYVQARTLPQITIDGTLSEGEWNEPWFTDNSEGPGTGYNDAPLPIFSGYVANDNEYLYVAMKVEDPAPQSSRGVHLYIDMPIMGVFNDPDVQHFVISPGNVTGYSYGELTELDRHFVAAGMPEGVEIASSYDEGNGIGVYEFKIPLTVIGSNPGDTIGLEFQATDNPDGWKYNFYPDVPGDVTPIFTSLRVEVEGLYASLELEPFSSIQSAIDAASAGDTINVAAGTYNEGIVEIDKDLTIVGATTPSKPIINPTADTGTANAIGPTGRGWFQITGATVNFENLVFDGTGKLIHTAVHYHGDSAGGTVESCDFMNIAHTPSGYQGRGINNYGQYVEVLNCTFSDILRIGVFTYNATATTLIDGCTYTGKGAGDWLDYAFEVGSGGTIIVEDCTITDCSSDETGWDSAGIYASTAFGPGTTATITGCDIYDNSHGVWIGYNDADGTVATLTGNNIYNNDDDGVVVEAGTNVVTGHFNNIYGNGDYGVNVLSGSTIHDFENNWWGDASGPSGGVADPVTGRIANGSGDAVSNNVKFDPFLFPNVTITKTGPATANQGNNITYTITYKNEGTFNATNVVITETYPSEVEYVSANPAPDSGTNNQWTIGTLAPDAEGTITVTVHIK